MYQREERPRPAPRESGWRLTVGGGYLSVAVVAMIALGVDAATAIVLGGGLFGVVYLVEAVLNSPVLMTRITARYDYLRQVEPLRWRYQSDFPGMVGEREPRRPYAAPCHYLGLLWTSPH